MEFPKRIHVVSDAEGIPGEKIHLLASEEFDGINDTLLYDGAEVAVYKLVRVKRVEVSRRLVKINPTDPDDGDEVEPQADQVSIPLSAGQP